MSITAAALAAMVVFTVAPTDAEVSTTRIQDTEAAILAVANSTGQWPKQVTIRPPERLNQPSAKPLHVLLVHEWNLKRYCGVPEVVMGCYFSGQIVLPAIDVGTVLSGNIDEAAVQSVFIHERAHAEGWAADHPAD